MNNATRNSQNILLVDDDEMMLLVLTDFFEARGYQVDAVNSPKEAVLAVRSKEYDVVISDLHFSTNDDPEGLGLVAELAKASNSARVFVLSGDRNWEVAKDRRMKRIAAYIPKPIGLDALACIIENSVNPDMSGGHE